MRAVFSRFFPACLLLTISCKSYLNFSQTLPSFDAPPEHAVCVVLSVEGNHDEFVPIYLDGELAAGTFDTSVTSFEVPPGEHYLMAVLDNEATVLFDFKPGKTYYLKMGTLEVPMFDGVRLEPISEAEAQDILDSLGTSTGYTQLKPEVTISTFDSEDYEEEKEEYQEWVRENPEDSREHLEYPGY